MPNLFRHRHFAGSILLALLPLAATAQIDTRAATVTAAEVPAAAYGTPVDYNIGYLVGEVKPGTGVWWVTEGSHQAMFVTTGEGVVVVDAPPIFGDKIAKAIASVTDEPVTHLIYSHPHADHIAGAWQFPEGIEIVATSESAEHITELQSGERFGPFGTFVGGKPVPAVTRTIADGESLTIGSQTFSFHELGKAHSHSDLAVLLPDHRIAMAVDIVWAGWIPFERLGHAEDISSYLAAHDALLALDWDVMVGGHVGRLATRDDVATNKEYVTDLITATMAALQSVSYQSAAERAGYANPFLTTETYFDDVARTASAEVEAKWVTRLGGADVWTYSNVRAVMMWLRLN